MLDLNKLSKQIQEASFDLVSHQQTQAHRLQKALETWRQALSHSEDWLDKALVSRPYLHWTIARPLEELEQSYPLPAEPAQHIVLATDGSQIAPSRHEVSPCYLLNISRICYRYGTGERALQESEPFLFYREQDLYTQINHQHVRVSEQMIGIERSLLEFRELANLAQQISPARVPAVALMDGSLYSLLSELINLPGQIQDNLKQRLLTCLKLLRTLQIPLCSYTSAPRKSECLQLLRIEACPYAQARCKESCESTQEPPCSGMMPLADADLWRHLLQPGERSPLFSTSQSWPDHLKEDWQGYELCFFYLHTGYEIARLEFPRWVAERRELVEHLQVLCWLQVQKGRGYPIALAEAHNQAVVKSADRSQFYAMLSRRLSEQGKGLNLSYKELKKRRGLV